MASEPVHVIRFGLIKCEIFCNHTRSGDRFNAVFTRLYRNGAEWKQSRTFGRDDLLLVGKAADAAHTWIYQQRQAETTDRGDTASSD